GRYSPGPGMEELLEEERSLPGDTLGDGRLFTRPARFPCYIHHFPRDISGARNWGSGDPRQRASGPTETPPRGRNPRLRYGFVIRRYPGEGVGLRWLVGRMTGAELIASRIPLEPFLESTGERRIMPDFATPYAGVIIRTRDGADSDKFPRKVLDALR